MTPGEGGQDHAGGIGKPHEANGSGDGVAPHKGPATRQAEVAEDEGLEDEETYQWKDPEFDVPPPEPPVPSPGHRCKQNGPGNVSSRSEALVEQEETPF